MNILLKFIVFLWVYGWSGFAIKMILLDVLPNDLPVETHACMGYIGCICCG